MAALVVERLKTTVNQMADRLFKTITAAPPPHMEILVARHGAITVLKLAAAAVVQEPQAARHGQELEKLGTQALVALAELSPLVDQTFC
jgi:hypothetical protein